MGRSEPAVRPSLPGLAGLIGGGGWGRLRRAGLSRGAADCDGLVLIGDGADCDGPACIEGEVDCEWLV
jgi:hypothetical protein